MRIVGRVTKVGSARSANSKKAILAAVGLHGRLRPHLPASARAGLEQFCSKCLTLTYNFLPTSTSAASSLTVVIPTASWWIRALRVARPCQNLSLAGVAPLLCAGHYDLLRRCAIGRLTKRHKKSAWLASADWVHMGVKFAHALGAACRRLFGLRPNKKDDALRLGARRSRSFSRAMPTRCKNTPAVSISFSTPFPPITTSTRIFSSCVETGWKPNAGRRPRKASGGRRLRPALWPRAATSPASPIGGIP